MIRDRGPNYSVGWGVAPTDVTLNSDETLGPNPNSSFIAKALNTHPIMRFVAVSAATLIGVHVASKMARGTGLKLLERLEDTSLPYVSRRAQETLSHDYRSLQKVLDSWEGAERTIDVATGREKLVTRAGFWATQAEKERASNIFNANEAGEAVEDIGSWLWRDEIQQTLVHQARKLPYELPALYATQRLISDRITGQRQDRPAVKWYHPVDVITDFASQSVKNLAVTLAPWELGQGALKQGWRNLMTYGDFATSTSTFNPHIRSFSMGLRGLLAMVGHDSSKLLYQTIQRSQQGAGAFSSAITEYNAASKSLSSRLGVGEVAKSTKGGIKGSYENLKNNVGATTNSLWARASNARNNIRQDGPFTYIKNNADVSGLASNWFPKGTAFSKKLVEEWELRGEAIANMEAMRARKTHYIWKNTLKSVNPGMANLVGSRGESDIEQIALAIKNYAGKGVGTASFERAQFSRDRQNEEYKKILAQHLLGIGAPESAVSRLISQVHVELPDSRPFDRGVDFNISNRIGIGDSAIVRSTEERYSPWHKEFEQRLKAYEEIREHPRLAEVITRNIEDAVKKSDIDFLKNRSEIQGRIQNEWRELYKGDKGLVDYARDRLGESKLRYEMFGDNMSPEAEELLIRTTARHANVPLKTVDNRPFTKKELLEQLSQRGFQTDDFYDMRNFLVSKGVIAKPSTSMQGFNLLGLKPLTVREAIKRNYFQYGNRGAVRRLLEDIEAKDPYVGDMLNRPVGRGVFESTGGQIVDFSPLRGALRKIGNLAEEHVQIPILGINIDLFGYNVIRAMFEGSPIQRFSGLNKQHFLPPGETTPDSYFWLRQKGSKGRIITHAHEKGITQLEGDYRPWSTTQGISGRVLRFAIGDSGKYIEATEAAKDRFKRKFSVNPDQQQSLFGFLNRIRASRKGDLNNPANYAKWILSGEIPSELTNEQAEAFSQFQASLRRFGITPKVARLLEERDQTFSKIFRGVDPFTDEEIPLSDIHTSQQMFDVVKATIEKHEADLSNMLLQDPTNSELVAQARRAGGLLRSRYIRHESQPRYLEHPTAQAMHSTGIHRRLDEFRADMYRYQMARSAILDREGGDRLIQDLLSKLDELKRERLIGGGEYTEARAAILGMQVNYLNLTSYSAAIDKPQHILSTVSALSASPSSRSVLGDIANYENLVIHRHGARRWGIIQWHKYAGRADYQFPGYEYNPYAQENAPVPTFSTTIRRGPVKALASVLGFNTWSNPQAFSGASVPISHAYQRLNRYFSTFGVGLNETDFKGPLDFYARGLVGKRVFPAVVAGSVLLAADRTAGGVGNKDQYGHRVYKPFIGRPIAFGLAHAQVGLAGVLPGGETASEKREELFGSGEVPIRKGRWWPLGNQPFKGTRVQYFRPSWYKTYMSGYQFTGENWSSPAEKLLYGHDFSPGKIISPYHWEKKHAHDRPYPVSGEYFTGPWGPVSGFLNATAGQILKPHVRMHKKEMERALGNYGRVGQFATVPIQSSPNIPVVAARNMTGSAGTFAARPAGEILGIYPEQIGQVDRGQGGYPAAYRQPYGFLGVPYGTPPDQAIKSYRHRRPISLIGRSRGSNIIVGSQLGQLNAAYEARAAGPPARITENGIHSINRRYEELAEVPAERKYDPYNRVVMLRTRNFDPRVAPAGRLINPGKLKHQAGQIGYETQEMFGIYGFLFGQARKAFGFGSPDYTPERPVMQSAARGYGAERAFWDLNLGGLGDFPNLSEGEYGNLEVSEIARRFIPHRRRDINEVNPLTNDLGKMYPWLPGNDYFINFKQGDPYVQIPQGELRLPGLGYERTHQLHPDATGKYGLLDQHAILGDIAPWSREYKAIDQIMRKMQTQLAPEDLALVRQTRKQVAAMNKRHEFHPYQYAHTNFQTAEATVVGLKSDKPHILITDKGEIRLAGVRAHNTEDARLFMESMVHKGDTIKYTYDANKYVPRDAPIDAIIKDNGTNVNKELLKSEYSYKSRVENPIDDRVTKSRTSNLLNANIEKLKHRNTILNVKFSPYRTAVEDWERIEIYGSSFPQWQHPIRDFLKPLGFRAMNRNPIISAAILAGLGQMFMRNPDSKAVGRVVGGVLGLGIGLFSDAKTFQTGERFVPLNRRKEMGVDEYTDILNYVKYSRLYTQKRQEAIEEEHTDPESLARALENSKYKRLQFTNLGPATSQALTYRRNIHQTLYGADVYGDVMDIAAAIPKKKRDHFMDFLTAPIDERPRILSTAPRLERRIYEARWGMKVERRPDLVSYFSEHELPSPDWEGWDPDVKTDTIKLKIAQSQGIDASQMGYFPQQIQEANLINPSYPEFKRKDNPDRTAARLKALMRAQNINGHVIAIPSPSPGVRVQLSAGVG